MRQTGLILMIPVFVLGAWLASPTPGEAGEISISLGVGFVVGGSNFRVAYATGGYYPYYYRLEAPLRYPGYACTDYCYVGGGHFYHAPFCPIVRFHFDRHRYVDAHYGHSRHYRYDRGHHHRTRGHRHREFYRRGRGYGRHHYNASRHRDSVRHHDSRGKRGKSYGHRGGKSDHRRKSRSYDHRKDDRRRDAGRTRDPGRARRTRPPGR